MNNVMKLVLDLLMIFNWKCKKKEKILLTKKKIKIHFFSFNEVKKTLRVLKT